MEEQLKSRKIAKYKYYLVNSQGKQGIHISAQEKGTLPACDLKEQSAGLLARKNVHKNLAR